MDPITEYERAHGIPMPTRNKGTWDLTYDRDRAAEARHGGRYITEQLNSGRPKDADTLRTIQDTGDAAKVAEYWRFALSPSGSAYPSSGRDTTATLARDRAAGKGPFGKPQYGPPPALPESAFDWPIYRAAFAPSLGEALADARLTINREGHDADCALRCIPDDTLDCGREHACSVCVGDDSRPLPEGCTGYWPDLPSVIQPHHDGATCPVHETAVP